MATELIRYKNGYGSGAPNALFRRILNTIPGLVPDVRQPSRSSRVLNEFLSETCGKEDKNEDAASEMPALSEIYALEREGWKRSMSATLALLRYANVMLEQSEKTVAEQSARISQLETMVTTDELTGLKNRRGFFERFVGELDACERGASEGGLLVLIDLDNFKSINDTHGHLAGDACLRLVARTLAEDVRLMDVAARLGGDEFVLLLSNTTRKKAAGRAQQLAWRLNNLSLAWQGDVIPVRASLGLKNYAKGDQPDHIFRAADDNLYGEKQSRKDDIEIEVISSFPERIRTLYSGFSVRDVEETGGSELSSAERIRIEF